MLKEIEASDYVPSNDVANQIDKLMWNIKSTAGSRFAAAKRLVVRDRRLTYLTAFASAYIIILTVLPYILRTPQNLSDRINIATVAIAVVILVSSLLQYSSGDVVNAEQYHRSALELNELRREIKALKNNIDEEKFLKYSAKYSRILEKYSVNHDDVDFIRFKFENLSYYKMGLGEVCFGKVRMALTNSLPIISLIFLTMLCLALGYYGLNTPSVAN